MSRISIAMTTYCGEKYIEKQLRSLLSQKRQADEVIIIDDCSKDRTAQIVCDFISQNDLINWHFEVNDKNLGFIRNFKRAISMTTGNIVFLCDQDDIWNDDKLKIIEKLFLENPDACAVNGSFTFIDGNDVPIDVRQEQGTSNNGLIFKELQDGELCKFSEDEILRGNITPGCITAFSGELREYYLEHTSLLLPHDFEINIYAAKKDGLYFYNKSLISYRIHDSNVIGLDTSEGSVRTAFNGSEDIRLKLLKEQENQAEFFSSYITDNEKSKEYIKNYIGYVNARSRALRNHSIVGAAEMFKYRTALLPQIPSKRYIGDTIYALRLQKLFKG